MVAVGMALWDVFRWLSDSGVASPLNVCEARHSGVQVALSEVFFLTIFGVGRKSPAPLPMTEHAARAVNEKKRPGSAPA